MKIQIEITEEDAAAIWANHWKRKNITETIKMLADRTADIYRDSVSSTQMERDLEAFRAVHVNHDDPEFQAVDTSKMFPITHGA